MKKLLAILIAAIMLLAGTSLAEGWEGAITYVGTDGPIVTTTGGDVLGYKLEGVYRFLGIPYARAARFETAQPAVWQGVYTANTYGTVCPIEDDSAINFTEFITPSATTNQIKNEDCLNLNVWTTTLDATAKKPVIVWLHGGGFSSGSSTELKYYAGDNLSMEGDLVVVSLNHRLNALGFLDVAQYGDRFATSANNGMNDIVVALQWIRDNITVFGGDAANVTIVGQSGGAGKVLTLCGMPSAQGLFTKAIAQSGASGAGNAEASKRVGELTLEFAGCATVEELQAISYDSLIASTRQAIVKAGDEGLAYSWGPVVDGVLLPTPTVAEGKFTDIAKDVTLIVSTTLGEFTGNSVPASKGFPGDYNVNKTEEEAMAALNAKFGEGAQAVANAFKAAYPSHPLMEAMFTDNGFFLGAASTVAAKAAQADEGGAPVYQYVFALDYDCYGGCTPSHCAEIPFFMHNVDMIPEIYYSTNAEAKALENTICKAYSSFAYTGNPSIEGLEWTPYTTASPAVMVFDAESYMLGNEALELVNAINAAGAADLNAQMQSLDETAEGK